MERTGRDSSCESTKPTELSLLNRKCRTPEKRTKSSRVTGWAVSGVWGQQRPQGRRCDTEKNHQSPGEWWQPLGGILASSSWLCPHVVTPQRQQCRTECSRELHLVFSLGQAGKAAPLQCVPNEVYSISQHVFHIHLQWQELWWSSRRSHSWAGVGRVLQSPSRITWTVTGLGKVSSGLCPILSAGLSLAHCAEVRNRA